MNSFDRNLDRWITGENDPNAPFNQPDNEENPIEFLEQAFEEKDSDRFYELMDEAREKVNFLIDHARLTDQTHLLKKLNEIYNIL